MFAICPLSIVPVRKENSDRSEMVTQLLFGERIEILDKQESWRKVRLIYDDYTGWVDKKQIHSITEDDYLRMESSPSSLTLDMVQLVFWDKDQVIPVVLGSSLPGYSEHKFSISKTEFHYTGNVTSLLKPDPSHITEQAYMYLNAPYLWGGRTPFGIDCSGFTQMVFKLCGIKILRDAAQQAQEGSMINLLDESKPGDLAFFDNAEGRIVHTGIILPGNKIIHASGRVRIDLLDHQGIFNERLGKYSHKLRVMKRFL